MSGTQASVPRNPANIDQYKGENRLLLIFSPSAEDMMFTTQKDMIENQKNDLTDDDLAARDLLLFYVLDEGESWLKTPTQSERTPLDDEQAASLFEHFDVPKDVFTLILVGKDGTEKQREAAAKELSVLFEKIDSMPMRQREMQEDCIHQ